MTNDDKMKALVESVADQLGEQFGHVQVLVTWDECGKSKDIMAGRGNWYARKALVEEFLERNNAYMTGHEIATQMNRDEED
jgi:hypothetical protein